MANINELTRAILTDFTSLNPVLITFGQSTVIRPIQQSNTDSGTLIHVDNISYHVYESFQDVVNLAAGSSVTGGELYNQWNKRAQQFRKVA